MNANKLQEQLDHLMELSEEAWEEKNYLKSIKYCEDAWNILPEPKVNHEDSYMIIKDIIETYGLIDDWQNAKKWVPQIFECDKERVDDGDREFIAGKVEFELGNIDEAKKLFHTADMKSKSACFEDEDPKYKAIL